MKKYEFTGEECRHNGHLLRRIRATRDFGDVKSGDLGGWIEREENLSQDGNCWVMDDAKVYDNAQVFGNARISYNAQVYNNARVYDNAEVFNNAEIYGDSNVCSDAEIFDNAHVYDSARISGTSQVYGNANVYGDVLVSGWTEIFGDAEISSARDYIVFKNWWSSGRYFTWTRSNNMWKVGCFYGTGKELVTQAYKDSTKCGREYERIVLYVKTILTDKF